MKTKAHTVYKNKAGKRVPGVTTILNILDKPALVYWAWNLGLEGENFARVRDEAAEIGSITHDMIKDDITGQTSCYKDYSPPQMDIAQRCFDKYLVWKKDKCIEPILVEQYLVSEEHQYGGTLDLYCLINGVKSLPDWKTSTGIYGINGCQLSGYNQLLRENGYLDDGEIEEFKIVRFGKEEGPAEEKEFKDIDKYFEAFKVMQNLYQIKKELKL